MVDCPTAFVTGWPVEHSRSPMIHGHWLRTYGLQGNYVKHGCAPEEFADFIFNLETYGFVGGNITLPHKQQAFQLIQNRDAEAQRLGAVNTVWLDKGVLRATNTDGYGFLANLDDQCPGWDNHDNRQRGALVLGAGGASRAIIDSLKERKFSLITIANRTRAKAESLVQQFGPVCQAVDYSGLQPEHRTAAVIVNTTSLGMNDQSQAIDLDGFAKDTVVCDIVYTPLITPLLQQARNLGMQSVDGLGMLLHQAVPGFEKWFGVRPEVDAALKDLVLADLGESR